MIRKAHDDPSLERVQNPLIIEMTFDGCVTIFARLPDMLIPQFSSVGGFPIFSFLDSFQSQNWGLY